VFARGIMQAMQGPTCPLCHRGGEPWAFQTFARVAKVIGNETMEALSLKVLNMSVDTLREAAKLYNVTKGATPEETDRMALEWLKGRGWQCLPPTGEVR